MLGLWLGKGLLQVPRLKMLGNCIYPPAKPISCDICSLLLVFHPGVVFMHSA